MMAMPVGQLESGLLLAAARHEPCADCFDRHPEVGVDWSAVFDAARDHGVLPLLVQTLSPRSQMIGTPFFRPNQEVRLNHLRNMYLFAELRRINQSLAAADIRMLPYKGPTLALQAYGDLALRHAGDLDLLVAPVNAEAAEQVLLKLGYVPETSQPTRHEASAHDYHRGFHHPERATTVELHWRVVGEAFSFEPQFDDLWQRGGEIAVGDQSMRVMSPEDTLIVLAAHGMKHFWSRLGWICDVAELMRRFPTANWQLAIDRAQQLGGKRIVMLAMQLAHDCCSVPLTVEIPRAVRKGAMQLRKHLFAKRSGEGQVTRGMRMELAGGGRLASLLFHWRMRERSGDGMRYVLHRMFTPTAIEKEWIELPRILRPLYFLVRPIRLTLANRA